MDKKVKKKYSSPESEEIVLMCKLMGDNSPLENGEQGDEWDDFNP